MSRPTTAAARVGAAAAGLLLGAALVFGLGALGGAGEGSPRTDPTEVPEPSDAPDAKKADKTTGSSSSKARKAGTAFLAWAPGSVPADTEARLEKMPQVEHATTVYAGLDWMKSARNGTGLVEGTAPGYGIPLELAAVEPREYARFVARRDRSAVRALSRGEIVLAETEVELRGAGRGLRIDVGERTVRASGVVSDLTTNGYEGLLAGPPPAEWQRADRFVLAHLRRPSDRTAVERVLESLMPPGQPLQTRVEGENPFLRYGDAVLPQLLVKDAFGEFAARPLPDGTIQIEDDWVRENIRSADVPILGEVTCHRALFPQLVGALGDIQEQGLAHTVHPQQFSGCYSARFISSDPTGRLSHHSWGIAIDLNAPENTFGTKGNMDTRVVDIFEDRWGFTWGGRWVVPDAMHFEWIKFP